MDRNQEPRLRPTLRELLEEVAWHLRHRQHERRRALPSVERVVEHRHRHAVEHGWDGTGAARLGLPDTRMRRRLVSVVGMEQPDPWRMDPPAGWIDIQIWPAGTIDLSHDESRANALTRRFWDIRDVAWSLGGMWTHANGGDGGRRGCRVRIRGELEEVFQALLSGVSSPDGLNIGFRATVARRGPPLNAPPDTRGM